MKIPALPFTVTDWSQVAATTHPGESGSAFWRTLEIGDVPGVSRFSDVLMHIIARANARPGMTTEGLPLHESLLDHEVTGFAVIAFDEAAGIEHLAQLFQHPRAAAHHDAVVGDIQRRLADIVEQLR